MALSRPRPATMFLFITQASTRRVFVVFELEEGKKGPQAVKVEVVE